MTAPTLTEFLLARYDEEAIDIRLAKCPCCLSMLDENLVTQALADIEAKRAIVRDRSFRESQNDSRLSIFGERILGTLAAVYADHPDYDEAWRA